MGCRYMYQIIVKKKDLEPELLSLLVAERAVLPAWDPMGALAADPGATLNVD
jgi:aminopeptidase C